MGNMKVLMVAPVKKNIHAQRPLDWLLDRGCQVSLLDSPNPFPGGRENFRYLPILRVPGREYYQKVVGQRLSKALSQFLLVQELRFYRRYCQPDITHIHWIDPERSFACLLAGLKPLVLTAWGSDINEHFRPGADPVLRRQVARVLAGADLTLVDTPDIAEKCSRLAGRQIPTRLLPLGIDTDLFQPLADDVARKWRRRLEVAEDAKIMLSMRALSPNYGHHLILEAFARALDRFNPGVFLVFKLYNRGIADRDSQVSEYEQRLKQRVAELNLEPRVRWLEKIEYERLPEHYALADVILNFPLQDAFPVTFLEAAACQRPVISGNLPAYAGSLAEKYFHLVEPENREALAEAMVQFVNGPPAPPPYLSEARQTVVREYEESLIVQRLMDIYEELISSHCS
jgi:glycosyltransferase involved in cell wall biosynthesis